MNWHPSPEQLLCRDLQHSWTPFKAHSVKGGGYLRTLICVRCNAEKYQWLDRNGYILRNTMSYPSGYLRPGEGRLTRDERAELRIGNLS